MHILCCICNIKLVKSVRDPNTCEKTQRSEERRESRPCSSLRSPRLCVKVAELSDSSVLIEQSDFVLRKWHRDVALAEPFDNGLIQLGTGRGEIGDLRPGLDFD